MKTEHNPYVYFLAAMKKEVNYNWKGKYKLLADKSLISVPFLSELLHDKKKAGIETQGKIAIALGYNYEDMIACGRKIIDNETSQKTNYEDKIKPKPNLKLIELPERNYPQINHRLKLMQENLLEIYNHGDHSLISAIEMNLVSFRKTVEMEKRISKLEKQNEKSESENLSLKEENETLKKMVRNPGG